MKFFGKTHITILFIIGFLFAIYIEIILINSYLEAKKYEEFEIWMEYEMTKENLVISFNDSGNGIPAEVRGKIFDPFFSTKDLSEGTGIGLVLAKDILTRYGGDIYLDTKRKNTCFKIKFKLQKGVVTGE